MKADQNRPTPTSLRSEINFLLTNRIPRRQLTRLFRHISRIESRRFTRAGIWLWRRFCDLDLSDSAGGEFRSLHAVFTRALRSGARPINPDSNTIVSPCDGIIGAMGRVSSGLALQTKGLRYSLADLLQDSLLAQDHEGRNYVTLRLTAGMYHRIHAPYGCRVREVIYLWGDTWNVNPVALQRIERLYCRNERAVIRCELDKNAGAVTLVPVAAILVASIRLHFIDYRLHLQYRGPKRIGCDVRLNKGEEMGWFEHGSTIIVFAPEDAALSATLRTGECIRVGQPLFTFAKS